MASSIRDPSKADGHRPCKPPSVEEVEIRRPNWLPTATIAFGVLYLAAGLTLGRTPDADATGNAVAVWLEHHRADVRAYVWLLTLALVAFATVAALLRRELPAPHRDVFLIGAVAFVVETAVQSWLWVGSAWHADRLQPPTARVLLDIASYWGPVLTSATVTMLAPFVALTLRGRLAIPRWAQLLVAVGCLEQAIETITIFGDRGFIAPGGAMNGYLGAGLVALALLALALTLPRASASGASDAIARSADAKHASIEQPHR